MTDAAPPRQFFGKYRGEVTDNADPEKSGRLKVRVPAVLADAMSTWALPCVPVAEAEVGVYFVPNKGAQVWVEFEGGDPAKPIWAGCFWLANKAPPQLGKAEPAAKVIKFGGTILAMKDSEKGAMTLMVGGADGPSIRLTEKQIELACGESKITIAKTIKIAIGETKIEVSDSAVDLKAGAGLPGTVKVEAGKVALNGSALEVTTP